MIVVLPELHGSPRVLELDRRGVIELARLVHDGPAEDEPPPAGLEEFAPAWARLRRSVRHAKHFANFRSALHFYRFGNHQLRDADAARIVRQLKSADAARTQVKVSR
jgi:hypothetical protein